MKAWCCLLFVVLIGAVTANSDECPAEYIKPCVCVKVDNWMKVQCSNFTDYHDLQAIFDNSVDRPFAGFILKDSSVMYLNASWLTVKQIKQITVEHTSLSSFFDRTPDANTPISHIRLFDAHILRGVDWEHFQTLLKLREIIFENVEVRKLGASFAEGLPPLLRKLSFDGTKTVELSDTVFQRFGDLETFELRNAEMKTMKRSMFPKPIWLMTFDMTNNHIESLPDDMFEKMPRLRYIYLNGNKLKTLSEKVFRVAYQQTLFHLDVEGSPLECDCTIAWAVLSTTKPKVAGKCHSPPGLKDRDLSSLKKEEFSYCPNAP